MSAAVEFARLDWNGRSLQIEYAWVGRNNPAAALMVFLHEGLGSRAMWRDFPALLCDQLNCRGLVYSRPGYGRSTPRSKPESWGVDFMHRQAHELLPLLLQHLDIDAQAKPLWLFGHSDGGSIALLYAARYPQNVSAAIVMAPHIFVEDVSIHSIEIARHNYLEGDLKKKLARYHDDPDSAFWGWNDIWLAPAFRRWCISDELASIRCPVLALQGVQDEYGSLEQVRGIARRLDQARVVELPDCRHSPQREQPDRVVAVVKQFLESANNAGLEPKLDQIE